MRRRAAWLRPWQGGGGGGRGRWWWWRCWWGWGWWCPRWWRAGGWCSGRSGLLGLAVSVWLCLVTLAHLSLHPVPLVSQRSHIQQQQQQQQPSSRGRPSGGAFNADDSFWNMGFLLSPQRPDNPGDLAAEDDSLSNPEKPFRGEKWPDLQHKDHEGGLWRGQALAREEDQVDVSALHDDGGLLEGKARLSRLPAAVKVGRDLRVVLTKDDPFPSHDATGNKFSEGDDHDDVENDDGRESYQHKADAVSRIDGQSPAGLYSKSGQGVEDSQSEGTKPLRRPETSWTADVHPETQLAPAPAMVRRGIVPSSSTQARGSDRRGHPASPQPLAKPSTFPDSSDLRHVMNPRHPGSGDVHSSNATAAANAENVAASRVYASSRGGQQRRQQRVQGKPRTGRVGGSLPGFSQGSSAYVVGRTHLTRKNHDTIREEEEEDDAEYGDDEPEYSADRKYAGSSDSGGSPRSNLRTPLTLDTEDDVVAVGTKLKQNGFLLYAYNVTASDSLPMDRQVPDTRPESCPRQMPDVSSVGPVSVVICTHNEATSVLRRTVFSVLRHSPSHLISDVIVVDDNSTLDDPAKALEVMGQEVTQGRLRLLRTEGRQGLVRARLLGAEAARGKVLVFLDSHCECGPDWLPPLLQVLEKDKRKIVSPYIDVIRSESFAYARSPDNLQGTFNWRLEFGWRAIPLDEFAERTVPHMPIRTPVISGGLFAVHRQFFFDIGSYDDYMDIWGGENIELSFRVWMCGGRLEILPCSRVGHVFRSSVPYTFPGDRRRTVLRNLARAARVWMDEYSLIFFAAVNMTSSTEVGDVTPREALRERLQCRSFEWYLKTVSSQLHVPSPLTVQYGQFKNRGSLMCLTSACGDQWPEDLRVVACHGSDNQTVELLKTGDLRVNARCVIPSANKQLTLAPCRQRGVHWTFKDGKVYLDSTDLCLTSVGNEFVRLQTCRQGNPFQVWEPSYTFTWPE